MTFWYNVAPIYLQYRFVQFLNEDTGFLSDENAQYKYNALHDRHANFVRDLVYRMRGFYLKQAQLMSTQDDFVPPQYMAWCKDTQDNVPSEFAGSEARDYTATKMKEELGLNFDDVFESFDDVPLGVASIGEVHRAVLKGTKEVVAVKILVPGIEQRFRADIRTLQNFCRLAMPQHVTAFDEIERQFITEFNFIGEAKNLEDVRNNVMPKWGKYVSIPKPHLELCSHHVLVMEFLDGVKLVDGIKQKLEKVAALQGKSVDDLMADNVAAMKAGTFKYKSIAEAKSEQQRVKYYLAARDCLCTFNVPRLLYNYSPARLVTGPVQYSTTDTPLDLGRVLELLCRVEGDQIFIDGKFNGDCHPGNIMLLKDGRLGLIDYGQVKQMTVHERIIFSKIVLAHTRKDKKEVSRISFAEMGTVTKKMDPEIAYLSSAFWVDRMTPDIMQGRNIHAYMEYLEAADPMVHLPEEYIFACRVSILLRGMGKAFGLDVSRSVGHQSMSGHAQ